MPRVIETVHVFFHLFAAPVERIVGGFALHEEEPSRPEHAACLGKNASRCLGIEVVQRQMRVDGVEPGGAQRQKTSDVVPQHPQRASGGGSPLSRLLYALLREVERGDAVAPPREEDGISAVAAADLQQTPAAPHAGEGGGPLGERADGDAAGRFGRPVSSCVLHARMIASTGKICHNPPMISQPFALLRPYADRLRVALFQKEDDIRGDAPAAAALGAAGGAGLHQVHGRRVIVVREPTDRTEKADGMLTDVRGLALCIRWADCQNFVVYAPEHGVAGVLHAGWRGVEANAIASLYETLRAEWRIEPVETLVCAGPSLCQRCAEFSSPATELPSIHPDFFDGKHADLQGAATHQLLRLGVKEASIERSSDCTCCQPNRYWTYRGGHREEVRTGHTNMLACVLV